MTTAYYNEIDKFAAAWLRELIKDGHIANGEVDERSIEDVTPNDLKGFTQCHFFAGIGGWSYALRLAGWPDDKPVWTGSCPCQPFSAAGKREGIADERHLWPALYHLISQCRPATVFGEQVASVDGRTWLAGVRTDLEVLGYAVGAADLCGASAGAPQVRQRLYWVSNTTGIGPRPTQSGNRKIETYKRWPNEAPPDRGFVDSFGNKYRIPEPSIPFVVNGIPHVLDKIRGAGNAIIPQVAAAFVRAAM